MNNIHLSVAAWPVAILSTRFTVFVAQSGNVFTGPVAVLQKNSISPQGIESLDADYKSYSAGNSTEKRVWRK